MRVGKYKQFAGIPIQDCPVDWLLPTHSASPDVYQLHSLLQAIPHESNNSVSQLLHEMPTTWLTARYFLPKYLVAWIQKKKESWNSNLRIQVGWFTMEWSLLNTMTEVTGSAGRRKREITACYWHNLALLLGCPINTATCTNLNKNLG